MNCVYVTGSAGDAAIPTDYPLIPASNDDALSIKAEVVEGPAGVDMVDVESETQKDAEGSHIAELTFEADVENVSYQYLVGLFLCVD